MNWEGPMTEWSEEDLRAAAAGKVDFPDLNPGLYINPMEVQQILVRHAQVEMERRGYVA